MNKYVAVAILLALMAAAGVFANDSPTPIKTVHKTEHKEHKPEKPHKSRTVQVRPVAKGCPIPDNNVEIVVNRLRVSKGLPKLCANQHLRNAALARVQHLCKTNTFSHSGYDTTIERAEYVGWTFIGENLASGFHSADEVVNAWVASPHHYENLVNPRFTEQGIAGFTCNNYEGNIGPITIVAQELGDK